MEFHFTVKQTAQLLEDHNLDQDGKVQKFIDSEVIRYNERYEPRRTGNLHKSAKTGTKIGSGRVEYASPYGRFQYYGKVMVGIYSRSAYAKRGETKVVIDKNLTYHGGGMRGSYWFERMKADHKQKILEGATKLM